MNKFNRKFVRNKPLKETGTNGIEAQTKNYAKKKGCWVRKFSSPTQRGVPDDIFMTSSGFIFFIEFKSPNKKPTHKQELEINKILNNKGIVIVVDNLRQPGVDLWQQDFPIPIRIWHDGFAAIDSMLLF